MEKRSTLKAVSEHSLFGPPPLLEGEDAAAAYDEFYGRVCAAVKPADVIDEMLIVDIVVLELDILRLRRWKSNRIEERGLEALEDFLRKELDYKHYRKRFADDLIEILQGRVGLPDDQARSLANSCAWNESDAVDKVNEVLLGIGPNMNHILRCAKEHRAQELTQKYRRREPATVRFIDKLLAAAASTLSWLRHCPRNSRISSGSIVYSPSLRTAATPAYARSIAVGRSSDKRCAKACKNWRTTSCK
jgi:hypothetical protein